MNNTVLVLIIVAYFLLLFFVAWYTSRKSNNESFFIGNRKSKWWVVAFGMIGTSMTGVTFISVPGTVHSTAFSYFQVAIGYWLGYFVVAYVLLPLYYKLHLTSIYTYLKDRLGKGAHQTGSAFFILSRTMGSTLRLYLVVKILEVFILKDLNISFLTATLIIILLVLLYTLRGGVKTIVWTDTLQTSCLLLALFFSIGYLLTHLDLNLNTSWKQMQSLNLTSIFVMDGFAAHHFVKDLLGGAFITIAMTGLDQEMMQKNISISTLKDSRKNLLIMGFSQMVIVFIFLFLGGLLLIFAMQNNIAVRGDDLFPFVAVNSGLPFLLTIFFVIGLISALFPTTDGALTALTSSFCIDILGMQEKKWTEGKKRKVRYFIHLLFGLLFFFCVLFFQLIDNDSLIVILLKVAGYTYGPLLGLFAFGIFTKRQIAGYCPFWAAICSLIVTFLLDLLNNPSWYLDHFPLGESIAPSIYQLSSSLFHSYKIGYELLVINGLVTFLFLYFFSTARENSHSIQKVGRQAKS